MYRSLVLAVLPVALAVLCASELQAQCFCHQIVTCLGHMELSCSTVLLKNYYGTELCHFLKISITVFNLVV